MTDIHATSRDIWSRLRATLAQAESVHEEALARVSNDDHREADERAALLAENDRLRDEIEALRHECKTLRGQLSQLKMDREAEVVGE